MRSKLIAKVLYIFVLILIIYSCDIFAPYDLEFVELSTDTLNFGLFETEKQLIVAYKDSFDVSWEISQHDDWIEISQMAGIISIDNPDTISVKINRKDKDPGVFRSSFEIDFHERQPRAVNKPQIVF